jgi:hypothetical protein
LEKELDLRGLVASYYEDLMDYDRSYVTHYRTTLKGLVAALMSLREANADYYYDVIHEFPMQDYYGILHALEVNPYLEPLRAILDKDGAAYVERIDMVVTIAGVYDSCLHEMSMRPTYLTHLQNDLQCVKRMVSAAEVDKLE